MTIVHPIERAWITTGGTGAPNYDEFADESEITPIIAANPFSALGVEMPHRAPGSSATTVAEALPDAVDRLARAKEAGRYESAANVVVLYRITERAGANPSYGMYAMVDTDQISSSADQPGRVIRNEDVFVDKVRERVALADATGHLLSPVLLVHSSRHSDGAEGQLQEQLVAACAACAAAGAPAATDTDQAGRTHEVWPLPSGPTADRLRALAGAGELVVADGNHRSLAAQIGGLERFLAVITTPGSVTIRPYNRLLARLPLAPEQLIDRLASSGAGVETIPGRPRVPERSGRVHLYGSGAAHAVTLPAAPGENDVDRLDHARVEQRLVRGILGLDPADDRITYVGGDYPSDWLCDEVDGGRADLAVLIAPVGVDDFMAINLARRQMPRKSTWFTPKARAGLVLAQLP